MKRFVTIAFPACVIAAVLYFVLRDRHTDVEIVTRELSVDGSSRSVRLVIPKKPRTPAPLIVAFHGIGDTPASMAEYSRLDELGDQHGVFLAFPTAENSMWKTMNFDPENLNENPDVRFYDLLIKQLSLEHAIDPNRVYLVGMSGGASFAQLLLAARSERIAAVVSHSGIQPRGLPKCKTKRPIMMIVGSEDSAAEFVEANAIAYREMGHDVQMVRVKNLGHQWSTSHNNAIWEFLSKSSTRSTR